MIVLSVPTMAIFEKAGFKKSVGFGVVLTGVCAMVRGIWGDSFTAVLIATFGFAVAQPFILNAPGLVAGKWFPENERATANSVGMLCNYVGMCVGLLLTPILLQGGCDIRRMLLIYGVVGAATAVLFVIFVKEQPPTPPCAPELAERESFGAGMKSAMKKRGFVLAMVVFFFLLGVFNIFFTMIEPILRTCSGGAVDATQVGVAGVVILVAGIAGNLIISMISDRDARRRRLPYAAGANVLGVIGLALFIFAKGMPMIIAAAVLYGGFTVGSAPLLMTFAAGVSHVRGYIRGAADVCGQYRGRAVHRGRGPVRRQLPADDDRIDGNLPCVHDSASAGKGVQTSEITGGHIHERALRRIQMAGYSGGL